MFKKPRFVALSISTAFLLTDGLGTHSRLQKNADLIGGVAILVGPEPSLVFLATRLPLDMNDLTPLIIQQTERDATQPKN
jgi:hypothetical protein